VKSLNWLITITVLLGSGAAAAANPPDAADTPSSQPATPDNTTGLTLYGAHLMHYKLHEGDAAAAHFNPALPLDGRLLVGAMQAVARAAYNQQPIDAANGVAVNPAIGQVITLQDQEFKYRFILDGSPTRGVSTILVQRSALPPPEEEAELLKELEKL